MIVMPIWALKVTGIYNEILQYNITVYDICNAKIKEAMQKHERDGSLEGTDVLLMLNLESKISKRSDW